MIKVKGLVTYIQVTLSHPRNLRLIAFVARWRGKIKVVAQVKLEDPKIVHLRLR